MKNHDTNKESKFILYLAENNFYGWGMSQYLPYGGFKWLKNVYNFKINLISKKSPKGDTLEIDLEYPDKLHQLHSDYALALEKLAVSYDILSNYFKKIADKY